MTVLDHSAEDNLRRSVLPLSPGVLSAEATREILEQHGDRFLPILAALRDQPWKELTTSRDLLDALAGEGIDWSERTLRLYLAEMTDALLIERHGRKGYTLTHAGSEIARELTVARRLGSIRAKMEETVCQLTFDPITGSGLVSVNGYIIERSVFVAHLDGIEAVFRAGLAVGERVLLVAPGDDILGRTVPPGHIGLGTPCSISIARCCLSRGIPSTPVFGGLLHIDGGKPQHVLEMIRYDATTLSPNEIFIRANLTSVDRAARTGTGAITACYREVPAAALPVVRALQEECQAAGFPGILQIGRPGQPLLNVPANEGRVGILLATGLNPVACMWENDRRIDSRPMVGPVDYARLVPWRDLRNRVADLAA